MLLSFCLIRNGVAQEEKLPQRVGEGLKKGGEVAARVIKEGAEAVGKGLKKAGNWIGKKMQHSGEKLDKANNK